MIPVASSTPLEQHSSIAGKTTHPLFRFSRITFIRMQRQTRSTSACEFVSLCVIQADLQSSNGHLTFSIRCSFFFRHTRRGPHHASPPGWCMPRIDTGRAIDLINRTVTEVGPSTISARTSRRLTYCPLLCANGKGTEVLHQVRFTWKANRVFSAYFSPPFNISSHCQSRNVVPLSSAPFRRSRLKRRMRHKKKPRLFSLWRYGTQKPAKP